MTTAPRSRLRRFLPFAVLAAAAGAFVALGLGDHVSFPALRDNHAELESFVAGNRPFAAALYVVIYAAATAVSLPGGLVLTVAGGFLFGAALGTMLTVIGATAGATCIFLVARTALGDALRSRAGAAIVRMAEGFRQDAFSYMLVLRLVPLFPFFMVNLAPAFLGVSLRTYVLATLIGILPGTVVYSSVGAGLGSVFATGDDFSPAGVLTPEIVIALVGLATLSLVPVAYRRLTMRRAS